MNPQIALQKVSLDHQPSTLPPEVDRQAALAGHCHLMCKGCTSRDLEADYCHDALARAQTWQYSVGLTYDSGYTWLSSCVQPWTYLSSSWSLILLILLNTPLWLYLTLSAVEELIPTGIWKILGDWER